MKKILYKFLLIFIFFPYIKFIPKLDTQPTALVISFVIVVISLFDKKRINKIYIPLLMFPVIGVVLIDPLNLFMSLRSYLGYVSLFTISYAIASYFDKKILIKYLKISINIWFIVGFVQTFINRNFMGIIISDMRTGATRGVTSFAPEPTFYGIICIYFIILVLELLPEKEQKMWIVNSIFQILFFSKSSMTILFLGILIIVRVLEKLNIKNIFLGFIGLLLVHFIILNFMKGTRVDYLYKNLIKSPAKIFYKDESLNQRLSHVYYSIKGAFDNYLFPNGFSYWNKYSELEAKNKIFFYSFKGPSIKIMSGYGGILFETGFLGVILIIFLFWLLRTNLKNRYLANFIIIINFAAIQLSFPFNGLIFGILIYRKINKNKIEKYRNSYNRLQ